MKSTKNSGKLLVACIAIVSVVALLRADYYQPNFFPIGLTGLNSTGSGQVDNCPYSNAENWKWDYNPDDPDQTERKLIFDLGINCLGSEDANSRYIGSFDTTICRNQNNYLYQICIPSFMDDGDSANPEHIYIIEFVDITELIDSLVIDSLPDSLDLEN